MEVERGRSRSHCVENCLWKRLGDAGGGVGGDGVFTVNFCTPKDSLQMTTYNQ
jgi:hypothetical protein